MKGGTIRQPFNGLHRATAHLADGSDARASYLTINQHGTSSALAFAAAMLGPRELEILAQNRKERRRPISVNRALRSIDVDGESLQMLLAFTCMVPKKPAVVCD